MRDHDFICSASAGLDEVSKVLDTLDKAKEFADVSMLPELEKNMLPENIMKIKRYLGL